jgi:hypothetical protein
MITREEVKKKLKEWMQSTVRSTQKKAALEGFGYHPSDIAFAFRNKLGIKMNEAFVLKALGIKKRNNRE